MRQKEQISVIERWVELFSEQRTTLEEEVLRIPAGEFLSPERFELEQQVLFRQAPVIACLSADLPGPGDHLTISSGGIPIALVRQPDGTLAAFVNACRHRAAPVVTDEGTSRALQCPFHGWIYELDGTLRNQPRSCGGFASEASEELALRRLPVAEQAGFVFVRPSGDQPINTEEIFCGIDDDFCSWELDKVQFYRSDRHVWHANWKLVAHTFLEQYHLFTLHRKTVADIYPGHIMVCDSFGPNLRMPAIRASAKDLIGQVPPESWRLMDHAGLLWMLPPAAIVSRAASHWGLWRLTPLSPRQTMTEFRAYAVGDLDDEDYRQAISAGVDLHLAAANGEDFTICEAEQRSLESGVVEELLIGRNEAGLIRYTKALNAMIGERSAVTIG